MAPTTLREDAPTAYHFPPDVVERVDWSGCPMVRQDPEWVHGAPTFVNTRLGLYVLFEHLAGGSTIAESMDWFGFIDRMAIGTALTHAQQYLRQHHMNVLLDKGIPHPLRPHAVTPIEQLGCPETIKNGGLLRVVEQAGFAAIVTTDTK